MTPLLTVAADYWPQVLALSLLVWAILEVVYWLLPERLRATPERKTAYRTAAPLLIGAGLAFIPSLGPPGWGWEDIVVGAAAGMVSQQMAGWLRPLTRRLVAATGRRW